ncbi:ABC transporter ATP-binding protein [Sulfitobacter sp. PR48]|uniref:ABC transporter ATP-binding protein n=1 Tax=Sulfitobacter sp. PR48 TaxID=3028383 RepID=UPI00237A7CC9|nr:ABC transporter ATP-binding protein [Sulfitobacter sp. PR48]MDD9721925.1 ABC transporter ATP-binding protein [Sulfitobacter sp. PR48]
MARVEINSITKRYGDVVALDEINLAVSEGEFLTLLGPSGSGKTTLLNMISGLGTPDEGRILIGGSDITHVSSADRNIGIVFQSYALFPHMTVFDNVAFPLRVRREPASVIREQVKTALDRVKLSGYAARKPAALSGGQQQRVALARAIVFQPSILLLDEPLGALDKNLREELQFELRELQKTIGITTIMVTHDQEEAMSLSDRIAVFKSGRIEQVGDPRAIYTKPVNEFIANFFGANNIFRGTVKKRNGGMVLSAEDGIDLDIVEPTASDGNFLEVMIRPECISVGKPEQAAGVRGEVVGSVYLGSTVRYRVRLQGGRVLDVKATDTQVVFSERDQVSVSWSPTELKVLSS